MVVPYKEVCTGVPQIQVLHDMYPGLNVDKDSLHLVLHKTFIFLASSLLINFPLLLLCTCHCQMLFHLSATDISQL